MEIKRTIISIAAGIQILVGISALANDKLIEVLPSYEYVPLVREGVEWVYIIKNTSESSQKLTKARFLGTTELEGVTYNNLYRYSNSFDAESMSPFMYMREVDKVVYGIPWYESPKSPSNEQIYYDFNLSVGDAYTGSSDGFNLAAIPTVVSCQRLFIVGNHFAKGYYITMQDDATDEWADPIMKDPFIEGIGFVPVKHCLGTFYDIYDLPPTNGDNGPYLLYVKDIETNQIIYPLNGIKESDYEMNSAKMVSNDEMKMFYEDDSIVIYSAGMLNAEIYDMEGILHCAVQGCDELRIDIASLSAGVYILHVTDKDGELSASKFHVK